MKTLVVIQARMGGSRLPGKIKRQLGEWSVLEHVARRARHRGYAACIAAPTGDAEALEWSKEWRRQVPDNRGHAGFVPIYFAANEESDVLGRITQTALWANDMDRFTGGEGYGCIVRLTGDCPFVPVDGIDRVATAVVSGEHDYCETRSDPSARPNGIDAQAFTLPLLILAEAHAHKPREREHLTGALLTHAKRPGRIAQLEGLRLDDVPGFRMTLDTPDDLERLRAIAEHVGLDPTAGRPTLTELKDLHRRSPEMFAYEPVLSDRVR